MSNEHIHKLRTAQKRLAGFAKHDLQTAWDKLYSDDVPFDDLKGASLEVMTDVVSKYSRVSAAAASEWYSTARAERLGKTITTILAEDYSDDAIRNSVAFAAQQLYNGNPSGMIDILAGTAYRYVSNSFRKTILENGKRDPKSHRFARVTSGDACKFCQMLETRGAVYSSEDAAGAENEYHNNCACIVVPDWATDD